MLSPSEKNSSQIEEEILESTDKRIDAFEIVKAVHPLHYFKNEYANGRLDHAAVTFNDEVINKCKRHLLILCASRFLLKNQNVKPLPQLRGSSDERRQVQSCWIEFFKTNEKIKLDPIDGLFINIKHHSAILFGNLKHTVELLQTSNKLYELSESFSKHLFETKTDLLRNPTKDAKLRFFELVMETFNNIFHHIMAMHDSVIPTIQNLKTVINQVSILLDDIEFRHNLLYVNPNSTYISHMRQQLRMNESILKEFQTSRRNNLHSITSEDIGKIMTILRNSSEQDVNGIFHLQNSDTTQDYDNSSERDIVTHLPNDPPIETQIERQRIGIARLSLSNPTNEMKEEADRSIGRKQINLSQNPSHSSSLNTKTRSSAKRRGNCSLKFRKGFKRIHEKIECNYCDELFFDEHTMRRHIKSKHGRTKGISCSGCDKKFARYDYLTQHCKFFCFKSAVVKNAKPNVDAKKQSLRKK